MIDRTYIHIHHLCLFVMPKAAQKLQGSMQPIQRVREVGGEAQGSESPAIATSHLVVLAPCILICLLLPILLLLLPPTAEGSLTTMTPSKANASYLMVKGTPLQLQSRFCTLCDFSSLVISDLPPDKGAVQTCRVPKSEFHPPLGCCQKVVQC